MLPLQLVISVLSEQILSLDKAMLHVAHVQASVMSSYRRLLTKYEHRAFPKPQALQFNGRLGPIAASVLLPFNTTTFMYTPATQNLNLNSLRSHAQDHSASKGCGGVAQPQEMRVSLGVRDL